MIPRPPAIPTCTTATGGLQREVPCRRRRRLDRADAAREPVRGRRARCPSRRRGGSLLLPTLRSYGATSSKTGCRERLRQPLVVRRGERDGEERPRDPAQAVVLPQDGYSRVGVELEDAQALVPSASSQLDPACGSRVLHPVAVAVRRNEPAAISVLHDRHRGRPQLPARPSGNRQHVRSRSGEPEPRERANERVERTPPGALPIGLGRRRRWPRG